MSLREVFVLSDKEAFNLLRELRYGKGDELAWPDCAAVEGYWFLPSRRR